MSLEFLTDRKEKLDRYLAKRPKRKGISFKKKYRVLSIIPGDSKKRCFYCDIKFTEEVKKTKDHVDPLSKGNKLDGNRVYACRPCNFAKGNMTLEEFIQTQYYRFFCKAGKERVEKLLIK